VARELPTPSFNKFVRSKILEFIDSGELVEALAAAAAEAMRATGPNVSRVLQVIFFTDDGDYECRVWVFSNIINYACNTESIDASKVYRVYIEEFEATPIVASYDLERVRLAGFEIKSISVDQVRAGIERLLGLTHGAIVTIEEPPKAQAPEPARPREEPAPPRESDRREPARLEAGKLYVECVNRLWEACSDGCVVTDLESMLDEHGVAAVGLDGEYICALRLGGRCEYAVLHMSRGEVSFECATRARALRELREALQRGWEIVGL